MLILSLSLKRRSISISVLINLSLLRKPSSKAVAREIPIEKITHETESLKFETLAFWMINTNMQIAKKIKPVFNNIRPKAMTILRRLSFDISLENDMSGLVFISAKLFSTIRCRILNDYFCFFIFSHSIFDVGRSMFDVQSFFPQMASNQKVICTYEKKYRKAHRHRV